MVRSRPRCFQKKKQKIKPYRDGANTPNPEYGWLKTTEDKVWSLNIYAKFKPLLFDV